MNVTCQQCKSKLNIPDHKVPKDADAAVACPKCKAKVVIPAARPRQAEASPPSSSRVSFEDRQNGLICVGDPEVQRKVQQVLSRMGVDEKAVSDAKSAISKMEYHIYHLVVMDESFDQFKGMSLIMDKLNTIDMSLRRRMCLVLLSSRYRTNDNMACLHTSVNGILHLDDLIHLEPFLVKAMTDHKNLYTVYNESLKQAGKM